ncbi:DUF5677 domain-containing protein [Streptomyces collinus]|uniref:DUF5677 domain-containing protein n=1 Tax=Streptomyces collinus TaxID=42684 RepID=UPI001F1747A7|nr:DUF5677 domain-containing protein [Streptomyces collinus]UJA07811.1 hypothetical protein HGI10_17120 [Streptomyces collinus]UJA17323.1 hypothetical protein HGI09_46980 [Streptomyces collinus]
MEIFSRIDLSVPPARRAGLGIGDEARVNLTNALRPLDLVIEEVQRTLLYVSRSYWPRIDDRARTSIFNHAINDFNSLIDQLREGDGRNCARTSRSLYEHLVNYCWVAAYEEAKERYVAHESITLDLLAKMRRGVMLLSNVQRKRELHRLNKMERSSRSKVQAACKQYGPSFTRDWAAVSIRERAEICGFGSSYDTYRLLSQVTHGSFGGTLGTRREGQGLPIHRVGPSLELAVLAYPEGLSFFRDLCRRIEVLDGVDAHELIDSINRLIQAWPIYKNACEWLDKQLWPDRPPMRPTAILALYPGGGARWFLWEPEFSVVAPAPPPQDAKAHEAGARRHLGTSVPDYFKVNLDGKPVTVAVHGVPLTVSSKSRWYPAESILQEPERAQD